MKNTPTNRNLLVLLITCASLAGRASMTIQSLTGPVTATEISSYDTFMASQSPPATNTYDNNMADGTAGMNCESLGLMYEVTNDPALLNEMISYADAFISLRNDYTDHRVMWDGRVDPVWLTKAASSSEAGYAGCENNDIVGHVAYCAQLILESPSLWNQTVPDGNPHGYGVTYYQRATNYIAQMEYSESYYFNVYFINPANDQITAPTSSAWTSFSESTTAWNRQMMFLNGWQRLSQCHQILGDNPQNVALYNSIVQAAMNWFVSQLQPSTAGGQPVYNWTYAPNGSGSEDNTLHSTYDIWGITRAFNAGIYTNIPASTMIPFANTLQYVMNVSTNHISYYVNGTSSPNSPRDFIYPGWMPIANFGPATYSIMANMNIAQGSQASTAIFDAFILWDKNARYTGFFANNSSAADYFLNSPWIEQVDVGGNANYPVTVNSLFGFGSGVTISVNGLPGGVSASVSPGYNATITLSASSSATPGIYSATVTGSGGGITRTVPIIVDVVNSQVPGFSISATPSSQSVTVGGNTTYAVTIGSLNGFSGTVNLSVSGLPSGASGSFNPASVSGGSGSSTLTVSTATNTPVSSYTLTITGVSGSLTNSTTVSLVLNDFNISETPSSQTVVAGGSTNYSVTVGNVNGFTGSVSLSAGGLPSGASASFNPASVTAPGSSTMTVSTTGSTPAGTNTLTITGASGSLQHSTTAAMIVNSAATWTEINDTDPAITYSPGWNYSTNRGDGDYNNDVHYTKTNGNYAQYTFTGTGVEYITETYTDESNVDIYIDGAYQTTVNCYSATRQAQMVMYSTTTLLSGSHTIKIVKNGGTYTLLDAFAYTSAPVPDFAVSVSPSSQTLVAGNGTTYTATVTPTNGFSGTVNFSVSGLPSGASGSFNPTSVGGSGSSTLTVTTSTSATPGTYTLTITGISGNLTNSATATLVVNAAPDFSIVTTPSSQSVNPGANTSYTATITALNGFAGTVNFSVSGLPSGATGSFSPGSVNGSGSSTLTVSTTTGTAPGTYTLTVTGTSGSLAHSNAVTLVVNTPDFSISTTPASQAVTAGGSTNYTATVSAINGFGGAVSFSVSGLPAGANGTFNPASVNGSGSSALTVTTATNTPPGTYTLTVSGTSGSLAHSNSVTLVVNAISGGGTLPAGWTDKDIGAVGNAGSAAWTNGVFTIKGSGADIWGTNDEFNYAFMSATNNFTITAQVTVLNSANAWSKSGVMVRGTTATNSAYVGLYVTTGNGVSMQFRPANGVSAIDLARQTGVTAPYWVRLMRSGNTFTGYSSPDGVNWTLVGQTNVTMAGKVYAGLPVCSHDNTAINTSTFANVSIATSVSLSSAFNREGIVTDGTTFSSSGGLDTHGYAYSSNLLGTSPGVDGVPFTSGPANASSVISASGNSITLPAGNFSSLQMLATAVNGSQTSQTFTVYYADGSSSTFTQSLSDWGSAQNYAGETQAVTMSYRDTSSGSNQSGTWTLYGYSFSLNNGKTVSSITLPNNSNVEVLSLTLVQ